MTITSAEKFGRELAGRVRSYKNFSEDAAMIAMKAFASASATERRNRHKVYNRARDAFLEEATSLNR